MPNLFQYLEYREYLRDYYEEQKARRDYFSYRFLSLKLEIDASTLQRIAQGKAHVSASAVPRVVQFLRLNPKEAEYFETLVLYNKAKSEREAKKFYEELLRIQELRVATLSELQVQYFSAWYHVPVRGLLGLGGYSDNYAEIARSITPPISEAEAKESVHLLERLGLIARGESGCWELSDPAVSTGVQWKGLAIRQYQESMIERARQSLELHPKEQRDISTVTMAIRQEDLPIYKLCCEEFRKRVMKLAVESENPDSVYQLNIQLFPVGLRHA